MKAGKGKTGGGTTVVVGKGGVNVHAGKGKPGGGTTVGVGKGGGVNVHAGKGKPGGGGGGTTVGVGKGGVSVNTGHKGKHVYVGVGKGKSPFNYVYSASEDQLHDDRSTTIFFLEKKMQAGSKMELHFGTDENAAAFLPRQVSNSIPFSSRKFPEILEHFSIDPESEEADIIKDTINECEEPGKNVYIYIYDEYKYRN